MQGQLNERDLVAALYLHMRLRRKLAILGIFLVALAVVAEGMGVMSWLRGQRTGPSPLILGGCVTYLGVFLGVVLPWRVRRTLRQYKGASVPYSFSLEQEGIHYESQHATGIVPWDHLQHWREGRNHFLLYRANTIYQVLP